jgi:hypothetical protein
MIGMFKFCRKFGLRHARQCSGVSTMLSTPVATGKGVVSLCATLLLDLAATIMHNDCRCMEARLNCNAGPAFHVASISGDCAGTEDARMLNSALIRDAVR